VISTDKQHVVDIEFPDISNITEEKSEIDNTNQAAVEQDEVVSQQYANDSADGASVRLGDIVLPTGLQRRFIQQLLTSGAVFIVTIILVVYYRTPQCLLGFVIAGILAYQAVTTKLDYAAGKITELCVLCANVEVMKVRNKTRVVFRTTGDVPDYYEFFVPGKKSFIPNHPYVIYFNDKNPKVLLAQSPL
jgi:hypothetical protein